MPSIGNRTDLVQRVGRLSGTIAAALGLALLASCGKGDESKKHPEPTVGYLVVQPTAVPMETSLGGRTVAFATSEIRPQVSGVIRARLFQEGGVVRQGQPLFQIDPSLYRAAVNQASANLQAARASAEAATVRAQRFRPLAEMEAISRQQYTDALAQSRQAVASVAQTGAALETAQINLRYTTVPAPIAGRIGRSLVTTGALVNANQDDALAVIQQVDPIYVDMQQSSAELLSLKRALASGGIAAGSTSVRLKLEDGSDYPFAGTVQFSEMMVNEATGTITLRARFPNRQGLLLPGMFVQARFDQAVNPAAYLVPQGALMRDIGGDSFVYVVGAGNKAERRKVTADRASGANWVVTAGLRPGDRIITQGLANLKNGTAVKPVPQSAPQRIAPPKGGSGGGPAGRG